MIARWLCGRSIARPQAQANPELILSPQLEEAPNLLSAPIELAGNWGHMIGHSAQIVIEKMRHSCLDGVHLISDRQPTRLRIDRHSAGPPAIWLHPGGRNTAWLIVNAGEQAWIQLAYQFGHELGHVMANSWQVHAKPRPPTQWLEESLVEAFALRGLGRLGDGWMHNPPFPNDNKYANEIVSYRNEIVEQYTALAEKQGLIRDSARWRIKHGAELEGPGLNTFAQALSSILLVEYERNNSCVEALGAMNRWPGRTALALDEYLHQWEGSCIELGADPFLPNLLQRMFNRSR
ncbi:MAG: hypothetical protein U1E81_06135 [Xanthobacteraceae bacterium]